MNQDKQLSNLSSKTLYYVLILLDLNYDKITRTMKHQKMVREELMYLMTEHKEQTGNCYTASCQYFPGLPNLTQSLSVCHEHCPFFFLSIAFADLFVNFVVKTSCHKSSK